MATLYDETNMRKTPGNWKNLFELLVTEYMRHPHIKRLALKSKSGAERSAYATCKNQTRGGYGIYTGTKRLRLELSESELIEFNEEYPLPE